MTSLSSSWKRRLGAALAIIATLMLATAAAGAARPSSSLPCLWNWALRDGLPPGRIVAAFDADCSSTHSGTLTIAARLFKLNPHTKKWQLVEARTQHWTTLAQRHFVELSQPCTTGTFKASFNANLRSPGGAAAGSTSVNTRPLHVAVPCLTALR